MSTDKLLEALDLIALRLQHLEDLTPSRFELVAMSIYARSVRSLGLREIAPSLLDKVAFDSCLAAQSFMRVCKGHPFEEAE